MADTSTSDPVGVDSSRAAIARVYDALLGGKDNYEIDREAARQLDESAPSIATIARDNRAFLGRVTRFLANTVGIDQFLDCGSGLPTAENTHQIATRINPDSRTVYVDHDPVVIAHGESLLEDHENTFFVGSDLGKPDEVLYHNKVVDTLDFTRPIALLQLCTLHNLPMHYDPLPIMQRYIEALPSGSYVVLSHIFDPADGSDLERMSREAVQTAQSGAAKTGRSLTREQINGLFGE